MLSLEFYKYLEDILSTREIEYPVGTSQPLPSGFRPEHLKCHLTAMQVAIDLGCLPVVGVQFLDMNGKLYPWPHMVNRHGGGLIDYSPRPGEPRLGFIETGWGEFHQWRAVTGAYNERAAFAGKPTWGDSRADSLSSQFLERLRERAARVVN